jgi:hypothetical protein
MNNKKSAAKKKAAQENKVTLPVTTADSPKINLYAQFEINFTSEPDHADKEGFYRLDVPTSYGGWADVRLQYSSGKGYVQLYEFPIHDEALKFMQTPCDPFQNFLSYPEVFEPTYQLICSELNSAARRVVEYIKFFLGRYEIADEVTSDITIFSWAFDVNSDNYLEVPRKVTGNLFFNSQRPLDYTVRVQLQEGIKKGITPFVAMRHIYRATQEKNPNFKWIDATIAAELAIKEALIRKVPTLAAFIEHVPSPPLNKLYGELMESTLALDLSFAG